MSAVEGVELRWVELPLRSPFQTSFGVEKVKEVLLLRMVTSAGTGLGRVRGDGRAALLQRVQPVAGRR